MSSGDSATDYYDLLFDVWLLTITALFITCIASSVPWMAAMKKILSDGDALKTPAGKRRRRLLAILAIASIPLSGAAVGYYTFHYATDASVLVNGPGAFLVINRAVASVVALT